MIHEHGSGARDIPIGVYIAVFISYKQIYSLDCSWPAAVFSSKQWFRKVP